MQPIGKHQSSGGLIHWAHVGGAGRCQEGVTGSSLEMAVRQVQTVLPALVLLLHVAHHVRSYFDLGLNGLRG